MRNRLSLVIIIVLAGCASTSPLINYEGVINVIGENVTLTSKTSFFNDQAIEIIRENNHVDEIGEFYLQAILDGYQSQITGIESTSNTDEGFLFKVKAITVKKGVTVNIIDPGPIYVMSMEVDVYKDGLFIFDEKYKVRVNMAKVVNPDKGVNWLSKSEKNDPNNQVTTFDIGLRNLYRNMLFKHLDISLQL